MENNELKDKKTIKINISGREYSLLGDDETSIRNAADEVNRQIRELKKINKEEPATTINVLAALNIAEKYYDFHKQNGDSKKEIVSELKKMTDFLKSNINY